MDLSFVIPCYRSDQTIQQVVELTIEQLRILGRTTFEFVLVNDCSPDGGLTLARLQALARQYPFVRVIDLAKNTGQHNAVMAALNFASGQTIISLDDDLQTHPSQLATLLAVYDQGYDVVFGYYPQKKHGRQRNLVSQLNHLSAQILLGKPRDLRTSSFWVMRRFVRDYIITYQKPYAYLQGLILRTTRNIRSVPVEHYARAAGVSGYTWKTLLRLWSNIIGFSIVPLKMVSFLGSFFAVVGLVGALVVLIKKLLDPGLAMGWPSMMIAICFFSGLNLMFMGLIGEYIGRMYLGFNQEPQYVIRNTWNIEKE